MNDNCTVLNKVINIKNCISKSAMEPLGNKSKTYKISMVPEYGLTILEKL